MMCTTTLICILAAASYTASASSKHTSPQRIPNAAGTNACGFDVRTFLSSANLDLVKDPASVSKLVPFLAAAKNAFSCSEIICEEMQIENLCFQDCVTALMAWSQCGSSMSVAESGPLAPLPYASAFPTCHMAKTVESFKNASFWDSAAKGNSVCRATLQNPCFFTVLKDLLPVIRDSGSNGCSILTARCSSDVDCETSLQNSNTGSRPSNSNSEIVNNNKKLCVGGKCVPKCRTTFIDNQTAGEGISDGIWCNPCHEHCVEDVCQPNDPSKDLYIQGVDVNTARYAAHCATDPVHPDQQCFESWNEGYLNLVRKATASVSAQFTLQPNVCTKVFLSADISDFTFLRLEECSVEEGTFVISEFTEGGEQCSDLLITWSLQSSGGRHASSSHYHNMFGCDSFRSTLSPSKVATLNKLAVRYGFSHAGDLFNERFGDGTCSAAEATIKWFTDPTCSSDSTFHPDCDLVLNTLQLKAPACCFGSHAAVAESIDVASDTSLFKTSLVPARDFLAKKCNINDHRDGGGTCSTVHVPPSLLSQRIGVERWTFTVDPYTWTGDLGYSVGSAGYTAVSKLFGLPQSLLVQVRMDGHSIILVVKETEQTIQFYVKRLHIAAAGGNRGNGQLCTTVKFNRRQRRARSVPSPPPTPPPTSSPPSPSISTFNDEYEYNNDDDDDLSKYAVIHDDANPTTSHIVCLSRKSLLAGLPSLTTSTSSSTTTTSVTSTKDTATKPPRSPKTSPLPRHQRPTKPKPMPGSAKLPSSSGSTDAGHFDKSTPMFAPTLPPDFIDPRAQDMIKRQHEQYSRKYHEGERFWVGISKTGKVTIWSFFGVAFLIITGSFHYIITHRKRCRSVCKNCGPRWSVEENDFFAANDDHEEVHVVNDFGAAVVRGPERIVENPVFEAPNYPAAYENDDDDGVANNNDSDSDSSEDTEETTTDDEDEGDEGGDADTEESSEESELDSEDAEITDEEDEDDEGDEEATQQDDIQSSDDDDDDAAAHWHAVNAYASHEFEMQEMLVLHC